MIIDYKVITCDYCGLPAQFDFLHANGQWHYGCLSHYNQHKRDSKKIHVNFITDIIDYEEYRRLPFIGK